MYHSINQHPNKKIQFIFEINLLTMINIFTSSQSLSQYYVMKIHVTQNIAGSLVLDAYDWTYNVYRTAAHFKHP